MESYRPNSCTAKRTIAGLWELLTWKGWQTSADGRLPLLYLIGKGKSLHLPAITWGPICAVARPIVPWYRLRLAVRAFSYFLRFLTHEITSCFHHHNPKSVADWYA